MGRFPFPIPTGWFCVAWTTELAVGQVKPLRVFAKDLVMFRTSTGDVSVLDAHCPHLGAHLGHGGCLEEDKLVCPFHAWKFCADGSIGAIPYAKKIPKKTKLRAWNVVEQNGMIYVWHDLAGREPFWEVPTITECNDDAWADMRTLEWTIHSCNQEMAENQVDSAHFQFLHGTTKMPESSCVRDAHRLHTTSTTGMSTPAGEVDGALDINAWGFGFTTTRFTGIVETLLISAATPLEDGTCILRFGFMVRDLGKGITGGVGKAFMAEIARQLEQDIPVWENKVYLDRPVLCDGDGPIGLFRLWCKQFYPTAEQIAATQAH
ncbi:MAG: Rieske 2Fe-2S domain-containing protein [Rhodobacterales bacterium]|nr:Rieske 2Fe-2S domain-containing protein [Rhodobacterales bacterium]